MHGSREDGLVTPNPLLDAFRASRLSLDQLWVGFTLRGGRSDQYHLLGYLEGVESLSVTDRNLVVDTINENLGELLPTHYARYQEI
ncbi:MAG: hypothetical protein QOF52_2777 [Propionibacteriaceae bacterium]|jgi:hypothetical protein|nr:hypothetical protein [Propionibacteriaceae bacterium]MDX6322919.1 hypothetical protein [Propionibacteriaceae bacterium]